MESPRELVELGGEWRFVPSDDLVGAEAVGFPDQDWASVTVPHTWQKIGDWSKYSHCWYRKHFTVPAGDQGRRIYLRFDGVGVMAEVYLNGVKLGRHVGAYTAFVFDATDAIKFGGDNVLAVRCDNKNELQGSLSNSRFGYFCVASGLFRPVWLFKTDVCHVSPLDYGSSGIYITETNLVDGGLDLSIKTVLRNLESANREFVVRHIVQDAAGKVIGVLDGRIEVPAGKSISQTCVSRLNGVAYWTPSDPTLYTVRTELWVDGVLRDVVKTRTGFRSIQMKEGQLILNGQPIRLFGASLHALSERNFHAVRNDEIRRDLESLKAVGFNSAFLAHYPHSQYAYDLADEMGLLICAENGFVNGSYDPEISTGIVREMVRQSYNHPSIFCWSASNEPDLDHRADTIALLGAVKSEGDSRRLTTFNNEFIYRTFTDPQADFVTSSVFSGWYPNSGDLWSTRYPYINQAGGGAVINHQTDYRGRYHKLSEFEPEGYQLYLGEVFSKRVFEDKDYLMHFWWAMKDFAAENYRGVLNTKGLVTLAWYPKDIYYLFQSCLRPDTNVLHICGQHWFIRGNEGNAIKVYSNSKEMKLLVNGVVRGVVSGVDRGVMTNGTDYSVDGRPIKNVFYWPHALFPGRNEITASDGERSRSCVIYFAPDGQLPREKSSLVTDLKAGNGPAWAINRGPEDQWPVYAQFDGNAGNTFDVIPQELRPSGSETITWINTRRQSDSTNCTDLSFKISRNIHGPAAVWLMVTKQPQPPAWISKAGFKPTGITGQWRDNATFLVDYELFKKECRPGQLIDLRASTTPVDYAVFVIAKPAANY